MMKRSGLAAPTMLAVDMQVVMNDFNGYVYAGCFICFIIFALWLQANSPAA